MPSIDRSGRAHATRQQLRVIYSQHKIEEQALNQGTAKRMNSNGASPGASTIFYSAGAAFGTCEELAAILLANSAPFPSPPPAAPTGPTDVKVVYAPPNPGGILVAWTASSSYVTPTYTIVASPGDITKTLLPGSIPETSIEFNVAIDGIVLGTTYTFVVTATNPDGTSPPSSPSPPIKAITYPDPPTGVAATDGEIGQSMISWTPSTYDGESPITVYTAYSYSTQDPVVHSAAVDGATSSSVAVTGLTNGFKYRFYVSATNLFGEGGGSILSPEIMPIGPPTPPLNVVATAGPGNAVVTWDAPLRDGGSNILGYVISSDPPGYTENLNASPLQVLATPLISGTTYTFTLFAVNIKGLSLPSAPSNPVIPTQAATVPDPPRSLSAGLMTSGLIRITWNPPVLDGGSAITSYTVYPNPADVPPKSVSAIYITIDFDNILVNGRPYTFTATAVNAIGESVPTTPTASVIPYASPSDVQSVSVTPRNQGSIVIWAEPLSTGGSAIINYMVNYKQSTASVYTTIYVGPTIFSYEIVGILTNGTLYDFYVSCINVAFSAGVGTIVQTTPGVTVADPPNIISVQAGPGTGEVTIEFTPSIYDGGGVFQKYLIEEVGGTFTADRQSSPATLSSLSAGTYQFTVKTVTSEGTSLASAPSNPVTVT